MNHRSILRLISVFFLYLCSPVAFAASPSESNEGLTEEQILSFMKVQDDAFIRSDAAAWVSTLADDFTDMINLPPRQDQPAKVMKRTRSEVEATAVKFYPTYSNIKLSHEDRKITISQDGKSATVTQKNLKKMTSGKSFFSSGTDIEGITLTTDTYELRGGKIAQTIGVLSYPEPKKPAAMTREMAMAEREKNGVYCMKGDECDDMWAQALAFARRKFSRELFSESDTLIRSTDPAVEEAERKDGFRPKESKMIIRRNNLGGGKYEIEFDFKCGTACIASSSEEMKKTFVSLMKHYQENRPKAVSSPSPASAQTAPPAAGAISIEDQLKRLQEMLDKKIITDKEYKAMRTKALGL